MEMAWLGAAFLRRGIVEQNGDLLASGDIVGGVLVEARKGALAGRAALASFLCHRSVPGVGDSLDGKAPCWRGRRGLDVECGTAIFNRGPRALVLRGKAGLAGAPDFYLSA